MPLTLPTSSTSSPAPFISSTCRPSSASASTQQPTLDTKSSHHGLVQESVASPATAMTEEMVAPAHSASDVSLSSSSSSPSLPLIQVVTPLLTNASPPASSIVAVHEDRVRLTEELLIARSFPTAIIDISKKVTLQSVKGFGDALSARRDSLKSEHPYLTEESPRIGLATS
jgi:hypothetical protein